MALATIKGMFRSPYLLFGLQAKQVKLEKKRKGVGQWMERVGKSSPKNVSTGKGF